MAKIKYFYNPHSLDFEKVTTNVRGMVLRVFGFLSASIVAGIILMLAAYTYIDSPKERILKREIDSYKLQTELLNKKMNEVDEALAVLQDKDVNIYRAIFEAEPMPFDSGKIKTVDVEKYQKMMGSDGAIIFDLRRRMETIIAKVSLQSKSFGELGELASRKKEFLACIPAIQPIANKNLRKMASGFGYRIHPIYKTYKMHSGIDFTAPTGTPIYATGNGRVMDVEAGHRGYGNVVVINHGFGYQTLYGHMYRTKAKPGQYVKRGELIGYVGSTGLSSGSHLHYEVIRNGKKINPINYFFNDLTEAEYQNMRELAQRPTQSFD